MRKIDKPEISQDDLCNAFNKLKYKDRVLEVSNKYEEILSNTNNFYNNEIEFLNNNNDYKDNMVKMYSERLSNKSYKKLYEFYTQIRNQQKKCPYCNYFTRNVKQLDHFLPKSKFPGLSLTINNLVPICKDCNELKKDDDLVDYIHPYYDLKENDGFDFIKCNIIEKNEIGFEFYINKIDMWTDSFYKKVKYHFEKLEIDELYLSDFEAEFDVTLEGWITLYKYNNDIEKVKNNIKLVIDTYLNKKTMPWRYAGFMSILESEWFFNIYLPNIALQR